MNSQQEEKDIGVLKIIIIITMPKNVPDIIVKIHKAPNRINSKKNHVKTHHWLLTLKTFYLESTQRKVTYYIQSNNLNTNFSSETMEAL